MTKETKEQLDSEIEIEIEEELEEQLEEKQSKDAKKEKKEKTKIKKDIVKELQTKLEESEDKYYRVLAEMKDLHKTYQKENLVAVKYVTHELMLELLPMYDIFSLVLENKNIPAEVSGYFKGFELVFNQFKQILENHDVSEIVTNVGDEFDYNVHNGVESIEIEDDSKINTISRVLQKGFKIGGKVLRPVSVEVFVNKNQEEDEHECECGSHCCKEELKDSHSCCHDCQCEEEYEVEIESDEDHLQFNEEVINENMKGENING